MEPRRKSPTITIPPTLDDAKASLGGIDNLLTAKQWERAAIVWAFTYEGKPGPRSVGVPTDLYTVTAFTGLKIKGLSSKDSVIAYRRQWQRAMAEAGALDVKPGQKITLPDLRWTWEDISDRHERRYVAKDEEAVARAIDRGDLRADVLASALSDDTAKAVIRKMTDDRHPLVQEVQRERFPAAPFKAPPNVADSDRVGAIMDTNRVVRGLHHAIVMVELDFTKHPSNWSEHLDGLRQDLDFLQGLVLLIEGVPDAVPASWTEDGAS